MWNNSIVRHGLFDNSLFDEWFDLFDIEKKKAQVSPPTKAVYDDDGGTTLMVSVPGVKKEELEIKTEGDVLTVHYVKDGEGNNSHFCESFTLSRTIPKNLDIDSVSAKLEDGVLRLKFANVDPDSGVKKIELE